MLQAMRDGAHSGFLKIILFGLLGLGVAGLVLMDVGGAFQGVRGSNKVAEVGRQAISLQNFDRTVRTVVRNQGLDMETAYRLGLVNQILMSEIQGILLGQKARELGIAISEEAVAQQIATLVAPFTDENTTPQQALDRVLASQGMSEAMLVETVRKEMANSLLVSAFQAEAAPVPAALAKDLHAFTNEKRELTVVEIDYDSITNIPEPSEEELAAYYDSVKERYAIPERRTITLAFVDAEEVEQTIGIADEELMAVYEEFIEDYTLPERRVVEMAILDNQDDALSTLQAVSKDDTPLEKAVENVTGSNESFLGEQTLEPDGLAEEIAKPVFDAEEGAAVGPVQTPLGWHVIHVNDTIPSAVTPFEEVRDELYEERLNTMLADELFEMANQVDDLIAGGAPLEEAVETFNLETVTYENIDSFGLGVDQDEKLSAYGESKNEILEMAFEMEEGYISPILELSDGRFAVIRADAVSEKSYPALEEVREDVLERWETRTRRQMAAEKADALLKKLETGAAIEDAAADDGLKTRAMTVPRSGNEENAALGPRERMPFFDAGQGEAAMTSTEDGFVVGVVSEIILPEAPPQDSEDLDNISTWLNRQIPSEILMTLTSSIFEEKNVTINEDLLELEYGDTDGLN